MFDILCRNYFNKVKNVNHKLHRLLPARRTVHHDTNVDSIPDVGTERYHRVYLTGSNSYNDVLCKYIVPVTMYANPMHTIL